MWHLCGATHSQWDEMKAQTVKKRSLKTSASSQEWEPVWSGFVKWICTCKLSLKWICSVTTRLWTIAKLWRTTVSAGVRFMSLRTTKLSKLKQRASQPPCLMHVGCELPWISEVYVGNRHIDQCEAPRHQRSVWTVFNHQRVIGTSSCHAYTHCERWCGSDNWLVKAEKWVYIGCKLSLSGQFLSMSSVLVIL